MAEKPDPDSQNDEQLRLTRKDFASWVAGPPRADAGQWPGQKLGLPEHGSVVMATQGRRLLGLILDWMAALLVSLLFFQGNEWATLAVFAVSTFILWGYSGATGGQSLLRLQVVQVGGAKLRWFQALIRTLLLCLVIPALIIDADGRGMHERASNSLVIYFPRKPLRSGRAR